MSFTKTMQKKNNQYFKETLIDKLFKHTPIKKLLDARKIRKLLDARKIRKTLDEEFYNRYENLLNYSKMISPGIKKIGGDWLKYEDWLNYSKSKMTDQGIKKIGENELKYEDLLSYIIFISKVK